MSVYGGFDPGTFQPWALNIEQNALGTPGVARGLSVGPVTPVNSMNVVVGVDALQADGICFLPNGAWLRIDAAVTLSVPSNSSGSTRTDAVVAFVDPTGVGGAPSLTYNTNWVGGFAGGTNNQFVLALINVPNGASSIGVTNIVNTVFQASIGSASPNQLDSVVSDNTPGAQQARIFSQYNVTVAAAATNGQTTFAMPLTSMQRLVPTGRIGGADELGYFAGAGGWYVPKLYGSTSGPLPVASVDYIGGNLIAASGAVAGETVVASFKYYDFARDLSVWTGTTLLQRNSPYIVYQGDLHASVQHLIDDLWDGTLNAVAPVTPGMAIVITSFGRWLQPHFAANASGQQFSWSVDGGGATTVTLPFAADVGDYGSGNLLNLNAGGANDGVHQTTLTYVTGLFDFAGVDAMCHQGGIYVDGGVAVVDGFAVEVGNTSLTLSPPAQGLASILYVDRYGNVTASSRAQVFPVGEALGVRVPLSQAVQYIPFTNASTMYGTYSSANSPKGWPTVVQLGSRKGGNLSLPGNLGFANSWAMVQDPTSPVGGVWQTSASQDGVVVVAPMTGLDLVSTAAASTRLNVNVDNVTSFITWVTPTTSGQRVRTTLMSSWPVATHAVQVYVTSANFANFAWSPEFAEVRYPELPTPPPQTLPLAGILSVGSNNAWIAKDVMHDAQFNGGAGVFQFQNDLNRYMPGPGIKMANTSTNQSYAQVVHASGAVQVVFLGTTQTGKFNVVVDGVSTYATVDSYTSQAAVIAQAGPFYLAQGPHTVACVATATRNAGSNNNQVLLVGIQYAPPPNLALDATRYGPDGIRPAIRGSAIIGQKGDQLFDGGVGVGTLHLQDRAVSSRKLTPTWVNAVTMNAWSTGGTDPFLSATVLVETPSVLMCQLFAGVKMAAGAGVQGNLVLDGVVQGGGAALFAADNVGNGSIGMQTVAATSMLPVGPGLHVVGVAFSTYGPGASPFFDGTSQRVLNVIAFAL